VPVLGVVGQLQFDVLVHRLRDEYNVEVLLDALPYQHARWVTGATSDDIEGKGYGACVKDIDGNLVALFKSDWALGVVQRDFPKAEFSPTAPI
jgi:peptide chain release factor 3